MTARSLPPDIGLLSWLAAELSIAQSTCYRLAKAGELAKFGVFSVGHQYRVSKVVARRAIHSSNGTEPEAK